MLEKPFTINWVSSGLYIENVDLILVACLSNISSTSICSGTETSIAMKISNQHSYTHIATYEIAPAQYYQVVIQPTGEASKRATYRPIQFVANPQSSSNIKILTPYGNTLVNAGDEMLVQFTGAAAYDELILGLEKRVFRPRNFCLIWNCSKKSGRICYNFDSEARKSWCALCGLYKWK